MPLHCWLGVRKSIRPVKNSNEVLHDYLSATRCIRFAYYYYYYHHNHNRFTALFPGARGWAGARRELLDFMVQGKINRGRHTDHPDERHSIRTSNQCPPPPSPIFLHAGCPSCQPTNSVKAPNELIKYSDTIAKRFSGTLHSIVQLIPLPPLSLLASLKSRLV